MQPSARREYAITLAGGWRGQVLVDDSASTPSTAASNSLSGWRDWLQQLVDRPESLPGYQSVKYSAINEVVRARLGPSDSAATIIEVICKRSSPRGLVSRAMGIMGQSRARRNFRRGRALAERGLATAAPLALIEQSSRGESWIVTEYLPDLTDLDQIALTTLPNLGPRAAYRLKKGCILAVAELFAALERHAMHHRDLKATNILLSDAAATGSKHPRAYLVDLDGLRLRSWRRERDGRRRLMRLAASLAEYPTITRTDYARFLRQLAADGQWKQQMRSLALAAERYNRTADRRRGKKWETYGTK